MDQISARMECGMTGRHTYRTPAAQVDQAGLEFTAPSRTQFAWRGDPPELRDADDHGKGI
jgi:hypothetical protein